ncbi:ThiF family adenylyltransferase [Microbacterium sp.]|uniref:ThiF family adenylyltransferase n=1 Tax=Microbacterium sp. TaxID=51671 RepID=UPI003A86FEEB
MSFPPLVAPVTELSAQERERTLRHTVLAGLGETGQRRLAAAHVAVIGAGGLGSPVILALAAAGVGTITVIDDDDVDLSNLQRQILHRVADVGRAKTDSAVRVAGGLAPETTVVPVRERLTGGNAAALLSSADLVVDGSDTFATRVDVAAACETRGIPLVWGVVQEFHAQVTVFWSDPPVGDPVTLADLYLPHSVGDVPTCAAVGVLGALCLQVGGMLATETVKLIAGIGEPLLGRVAVVDALRATVREVPLHPASATPAPTESPFAGAGETIPELTAEQMLAAYAAGSTLLDVREPHETAGGIVPGSELIPLGDVLADPDAVGDGPVIVICAHGIRARRAAEALRDRGVHASILAGGLAAWVPA